jgi:ParB/RepB/Spo0J family partition protein
MITQEIATALIDPPTAPSRLDIDPEHITSLLESMRAHGQRTPIEVHREGERYRIDAGHCRWLAASQGNIPFLRAQIAEAGDTATPTTIQTIENLHRSNLSPMEEAIQLARMLQELDGNTQSLARELKRRPDWIEQRLALLDLHPDLKELVHTKKLAMVSALHLNRITNDDHRNYHIAHTVNGGASEPVVRAWVEQYLNSMQLDPLAPPVLPPAVDPTQPVIVLMPCFLCGTPHHYQTLRIQRVCDDCTTQISDARSNPANQAQNNA